MAPTSPLWPNFGIDAGAGQYTLEVIPSLAGAPVIDDQAYALAYKGINGLGFETGLGFDTAERVMLTFDYRCLVAENIQLADATATPFEIDAGQSTFLPGLRTTF